MKINQRQTLISQNVRFGSWLCKNALAEALASLGTVAGRSDFLEFRGFFRS
jgi:hypothetical protein